MASSESMDEKAFSERVKKTFGSLFATIQPSPSSLSNPLWSLTDAQIEKKEWRRDKDTSARDANPCSSSFDDFISHARKNSRKNLPNYRNEFQDNLQDLHVDDDDDEDEDEEEGGEKVDINDWDIKSSIGLDSTLDFEAEEDDFDKVAIGRENAGDRLYMGDVINRRNSRLGSQDDLLVAGGSRGRDPRANRFAARIRLKEDDVEASAQHKPTQSPLTSEKDSAMPREGCDKLKPILKRKESESRSRPSKRVRFDPVCISNIEAAGEVLSNDTSEETITRPSYVDGSVLDEKISRVPGYLRNPSNYTRYSFDSADEMSDKSNTGAYLDFVEMVKEEEKGRSGCDPDIPTNLPKSVTFIPKKKSDTSISDHSVADQEKESDVKRPSFQSTFLDVVAEEQETEVGDMEVDEPETSAEPDQGITFRKQGRQYRKSQADEPS